MSLSEPNDAPRNSETNQPAPLPRAEERYRAFIANSTEGIWRVEADSPISTALSEDEQIEACYRLCYIAEANDASARMYGFERAEELVGVRLSELLLRDNPANEEFLRAFIRSGYRLSDVESVERDRDGNIRHFSNTLTGVIQDGYVVRTWGTQRDITRQREIETRLSETLSLVEAVVDATSDSIFVKDRAGRYVLANPVVCRLFDKPAEEIIGRTDAAFVTEEEARPLRENDEQIMAVGEARSYQEEVTLPGLPTGGARLFQVTKSPWREARTGEIIGVVGIGRDRTEQILAQRALVQRERDYADLVENAPDILTRFDRNLRIVYINQQAARSSGIPRDAFLGKTFADLVTMGLGMIAPNISHWEQVLSEVFATGERRHIEYELGVPGQWSRYMECDFAPEFDAESEPGRDDKPRTVRTVVSVTRDITDRRLLEKEREAQQGAQRKFVREMILSMTEGRLRLCETEADLPTRFTPLGEPDAPPLALTSLTLRELRKQVHIAARQAGFSMERRHDLETAVGEAGLNAVVHAGGGAGSVFLDKERKIVQVWIQDNGGGIAPDYLHRATLERGYTTAGTFGHGFYLMLRTCDRIYLLTGTTGTTVVIEQERDAPTPSWFKANL